jgi:hypothetical protein
MAKLKVFSPTVFYISKWVIVLINSILVRQMIGELCHVRFLVLTFVLVLIPRCRNYGRASRENSSCKLAGCFENGILRDFFGARAAEGMLIIEVIMHKIEDHRILIRTS